MARLELAAAGAAILAVSGVAAGQSTPAASTRPDAADLVALRQAGMRMMVATLASVGRGAEDEAVPLKRAGFAVGGLQRFAQALPSLYGAETAKLADTRAMPAIWSDPEGFAARAAQFQDAVDAMGAASAAEDRPAFAQALESTKAACKACHDSYRVEEK
jgi:cytochrome c556